MYNLSFTETHKCADGNTTFRKLFGSMCKLGNGNPNSRVEQLPKPFDKLKNTPSVKNQVSRSSAASLIITSSLNGGKVKMAT